MTGSLFRAYDFYSSPKQVACQVTSHLRKFIFNLKIASHVSEEDPKLCPFCLKREPSNVIEA